MYNFFRPRRAAIYIPNWQTPNRLQLLYFYSTETNLPQTRLVHESDSTKSKSKQIHRLRHLDRFFLLQHGFLLPKPASLLPNRLLLLIDAGLDTCPKIVSTHVPQFRSNIWFCSETLSGHDCIFETSPRTISKTLLIPPWTAYETTFLPFQRQGYKYSSLPLRRLLHWFINVAFLSLSKQICNRFINPLELLASTWISTMLFISSTSEYKWLHFPRSRRY